MNPIRKNHCWLLWGLFVFVTMGYHHQHTALAFVPSSSHPTNPFGIITDRNRPVSIMEESSLTSSSLRVASSDHFDMDELKQRIRQDSSPIFLFPDQQEQQRQMPERVYVVMFQPGTARQGAHTIEYPKGSGNNVILAFSSRHSCQKFANALKDLNFYQPTVRDMPKHRRISCMEERDQECLTRFFLYSSKSFTASRISIEAFHDIV